MAGDDAGNPPAASGYPPAASGYPPDPHLLRDLGIWLEDWRGAGREGDRARAGLEILPPFCSSPHGVRAGVLATVADVLGGSLATRAVMPDWIATCDLVLHVFASPLEGEVVAEASVLREGRSTVVIEIALSDARDAGALGLATLTFSRLAARTPLQETRQLQHHASRNESARTEFQSAGPALQRPLVERLGIRASDAGGLELSLDGYLQNSIGALQGGGLALLVDAVAEQAAREIGREDWRANQLALHYLSPGRVGPIHALARPLHSDAAGAVFRVEVLDRGAKDRRVAVATATMGRLPAR